jgi:hypothetical protein
MAKLIMTDGVNQKAVNLLTSEDPTVWNYFSGMPKSDQNVLYSRVAAAFRAYNLKANTVGNMPFVLLDESGEEFDNSATWENNVGFLPNPSELFRLDTLSYMATNTVYNLRTSDALGYKVKGLYHAVATTFLPVTNAVTGALDYIERNTGTTIERYTPEDKRLVRMWRLDHTTEVLPSPNTEAAAIMNAAGEVYFADLWIKHFYQRGGIRPTLIAMKGLISPEAKEEKEKKWSDWLRGLGQYTWKIARIFNAESVDVKAFGDGVGDLKDNNVYKDAIANIAMGTGMPLSLLMANSANYATSKEEKATWYENDIIPLCNWIAYHYNEQVFKPLNLFMEFHPETLDPQQEDETERAQAANTFMDFLGKCPTFDIFIGTCETFGYELSDSLIAAAKKYYADKELQAEETRRQMQGAGVVLDPTGKPVAVQQDKPDEKPDDEEDKKPVKWIPNLDQLRELQRWQELAFRKLKRAEPLTFEWRNDTLPDDTANSIKAKLTEAKTEQDIRDAFDVEEVIDITPAPEYKSDVLELAAAINRYADVLTVKPAST